MTTKSQRAAPPLPVTYTDEPQRPPTKAGDYGWIPITALHIPGHIERKHGETNFATYATSDITHGCEVHQRLRVSTGDALHVTRLGMNEKDPAYHWARVTIIRTKIDIDATQRTMTRAERCWMSTLSATNEAITTRRNLALDP